MITYSLEGAGDRVKHRLRVKNQHNNTFPSSSTFVLSPLHANVSYIVFHIKYKNIFLLTKANVSKY